MDFNCQTCGACCQAVPGYTDGKKYVLVEPEDIKRLTPIQRKTFLLPLAGGHHAMKLSNSLRCCALSGQIGFQVSCKIYSNRPDVCRGFEPGTDSCKFARMEAGISND